METTTCKHRETKEPAGRFDIGTCGICGQRTRYPVDKLNGPPVVIELGHREGKIVMPDGECKVQLGNQDMAELNTVSKVGKAAHEEEEKPADIPPRPGLDDPQGRLKWFKQYKKQLVDALVRMGAEAFEERYNVPRQIVSHLKASKKYKKSRLQNPPAVADKPKPESSRKKSTKDNSIASLPAWNDNWAPEVQLRWLEIYEKHFIN